MDVSGKKRALLSVSDKTGIVEFAKGLAELGFELLSTGGTMRALAEAGLPVTPVEAVTGFPEMLGGRVKTLHPKVHGGILADRSDPAHLEDMARHGIVGIDLVCVNLYPFEATVARPGVTWRDAIENIDIGGPAMVRAAAKNHAHVVVVVRPEDYDEVLRALRSADGVSEAMRRRLALTAFQHTAAYDAAISRWLAAQLEDAAGDGDAGHAGADDVGAAGAGDAGHADGGAAGASPFPDRWTIHITKIQDLRYGENPHQQAAFYQLDDGAGLPSVAGAEQLGGKQLSYNNINDADAALRLVMEFGVPAAVAVKHTNPCGVGIGPDPATAFERAFRADDVSIFGGIVAFNRRVDGATARLLSSIFLEIVIAPDFDEDALAVLREKKGLRLLRTGFWPGIEDGVDTVVRPRRGALGRGEGQGGAPGEVPGQVAGGVPGQVPAEVPGGAGPWHYQRVMGGMLVQSFDEPGLDRSEWRVVTTTPVPEHLWRQAELAWLVCKHVKSNAIVLAKDDMTVGIGAGQMNRIDAARHAIAHAGKVKGIADGARGSVMASDAFFPFPDVVEAAGAAGVSVIVQPGGSIRDDASIEAANRYGIAMVFTGRRHFRH